MAARRRDARRGRTKHDDLDETRSMTFLSPLLAWGMLLGLIPLIIHLLNRRRFRRVEWAPTACLRVTIQRNRRRIEVEPVLLVLVAIALPVPLFFFLAPPVLNPTGLE